MGHRGLAQRLVLSLLAIGAVVALLSATTFSAFSSTATTGTSSFQAGTVVLTGTGTEQTVFNGTAMKPGDQQQSCLTVNYTGSLTASLRIYAAVSGSLAPYLTTTIERGSFPGTPPANGLCTGFVEDASNGGLYSGKLTGLPAGWSAGIPDPMSSWSAGDSATYEITVSQDDVDAAQGQSATADFTVEARNS